MNIIKKIKVNNVSYDISSNSSQTITQAAIELQNDDSSADLNISDEIGNVIAQFVNGHIVTKNFDSRIKDNSTTKTIKVLFVGNSICQDHVTYLPYLLKNTYGDDINFTIGIFYYGGYRIVDYVEKIITDEKGAIMWSIVKNSEKWTTTSGTHLNAALKYEDWDIISMQGYFNSGAEDVSKLPILVDYFRKNANKPFEFAFFMHQTYNSGSKSRMLTGVNTVIKNNPVSLLFPCGFVTDYMKEFLTKSQLTPDGEHNMEGLSCIMGAYAVLTVLAKYYGFQNKVIGNTLRMTIEKQKELNIPGANGTVDESLTDDNYYQSQIAAIKAVNASYALLEKAYNEMYETLMTVI